MGLPLAAALSAATTASSAAQVDQILCSARSAGATSIVSRGHDPAALHAMLEQGLVRERLGHLVLTPKGQQRRRTCAPR